MDKRPEGKGSSVAEEVILPFAFDRRLETGTRKCACCLQSELGTALLDGDGWECELQDGTRSPDHVLSAVYASRGAKNDHPNTLSFHVLFYPTGECCQL